MDQTVTGNQEAAGGSQPSANEYYCPQCREPAKRPLVCGDCASIICRECGTPLERIDDLGIG